MGLLHRHPNPWQLGFMRAAVRAAGLDTALESFGPDQQQKLSLLLAAQGFLLSSGRVGPADRVGMFEARPLERAVVVLQPYGAREIALELYGDPSFYERVLLPYNRALAAIEPDGWVPAGTRLVVEPRLLTGRLQTAFMTGEMAKAQLGSPWLQVTPDGTAIKDAEIRYAVHWTVPKRQPDLVLEPPPGDRPRARSRAAEVGGRRVGGPARSGRGRGQQGARVRMARLGHARVRGPPGRERGCQSNTRGRRSGPTPWCAASRPVRAIRSWRSTTRRSSSGTRSPCSPARRRSRPTGSRWTTPQDVGLRPAGQLRERPRGRGGRGCDRRGAAGEPAARQAARRRDAPRSSFPRSSAAGAMRARATGSARTSRRTSPPSRARWRTPGCSACAR